MYSTISLLISYQYYSIIQIIYLTYIISLIIGLQLLLLLLLITSLYISYLEYKDRQYNSRKSKRYLYFYFKKLFYYSQNIQYLILVLINKYLIAHKVLLIISLLRTSTSSNKVLLVYILYFSIGFKRYRIAYQYNKDRAQIVDVNVYRLIRYIAC